MPQVLLLKLSKRTRTFITAITQIRGFSLNLSTSNNNFEKIFAGKIFSKEKRILKKQNRNFSEKHCVVTLINKNHWNGFYGMVSF